MQVLITTTTDVIVAWPKGTPKTSPNMATIETLAATTIGRATRPPDIIPAAIPQTTHSATSQAAVTLSMTNEISSRDHMHPLLELRPSNTVEALATMAQPYIPNLAAPRTHRSANLPRADQRRDPIQLTVADKPIEDHKPRRRQTNRCASDTHMTTR
jgi:hypothetical protein